jgi:hypothetical protein
MVAGTVWYVMGLPWVAVSWRSKTITASRSITGKKL